MNLPALLSASDRFDGTVAMTKEAIVVTGATGRQGRAVVNALLDANADVELLAVTRNARSESAQKLVQLSSKVKVIQGDLNNVEELFQNANMATSRPIWGVFSVQVRLFPPPSSVYLGTSTWN